MVIGLISDTHGLMREEVINNLNDCDLVLHAGDVGKNDIIERIEKISPVEFVYGNIDKNNNPDYIDKIIRLNEINLYLVHNINDIKINLIDMNINIVVYGHSHKSKIYVKDDILYINPGSVGPKRFKLEPIMAKLYIIDNQDKNIYNLSAELKENIEGTIYEFKEYKVEFIKINT